jgi:hypothetical protein
LSICIIEGVADDVQAHPDKVHIQVAIIVKVTSGEPEDSAQQRYSGRSQSQPSEKSGKGEADPAIEVDIEQSFDVSILICTLDGCGHGRGREVEILTA